MTRIVEHQCVFHSVGEDVKRMLTMKEKWMPENREQFQNQFRILFDLDETDTSVSFQPIT